MILQNQMDVLFVSNVLDQCWLSVLLLYRSQMQTIITNACNELRIRPVPSKRVCMEKLLYSLELQVSMLLANLYVTHDRVLLTFFS